MTPEVLQGPVFDPRRMIHRALETVARRIKHGGKVWDAGLGEVVKAAIHDSEIPGAMTPVELARRVGILRPERGIRGPR